MAAGSNSTVSVRIEVTDANSAAVVQKVQQSVAGLKTEVNGMAGASTAASRAFAEAGTAGAASFREAGGAVQGVRLAVQELGLHVPRAMESIIAHNEALAAGLRVTMGLFVAIGAIGIFAQLGAGAYQLYERWFDVNKAIDDYTQKAAQAAQQKLFDTASLETAVSLMNQANQKITELQSKKANQTILLGGSGFEGQSQQGSGEAYTVADSQAEAQAMKDRDAAQARINEQQESFDKQRLQNEAAYDSMTTKGYAQIGAKLQDNILLAAQELNIQQAHEQFLAKKAAANPEFAQKVLGLKPGESYAIDPNAGVQQYEISWQKAHQEATAAGIEMARTEREQTTKLQDEAVLAGLEGDAKYKAQREQSIAEVARKFQEGEISKQASLAQTAAIAQRFDNEEKRRQDEQMVAALKAIDAARDAGLTGLPKIQADRNRELNKISNNPDMDAAAKAGNSNAVNLDADNAIIKEQERFDQQMQTLDDSVNAYKMQGYARVAAEEARQLHELVDGYTKEYGADEKEWIGYQQRRLAIGAAADHALLELAARADEQIQQVEDQAARASLSDSQRAQMQIIDQYNQRVAKAKDALDQTFMNEQQFHRMEAAAGALANAEMEKQAEASRDRLAGQLQSFSDNPAKYMENRAKQMMFNVLANWMEQLAQAQGPIGKLLGGLFGQGPEQSTSANPAASIGSVFGIGGSSSSPSLPSIGGSSSHPWSERIPGIGRPGAGAGISAGAGSTATLATSGTQLSSSAVQLSSAATSLQAAATSLRSGVVGGSGGGGALGGILSNVPGLGGSSSSGGGLAGIGEEVPSLPVGVSDPSSPDFTPGLDTGEVSELPMGVSDPNSPDYQSGISGSASGLSKGLGIAGAAVTGAMGLYSAFKSSNPLAGALSGGLAGMQIGNMIAPGIGALVGGAIGAVSGLFAGLFGDHGLAQAQAYDQHTVQPKITDEIWGVSGSGSYTQGLTDLSQLYSQAKQATNQFGSAAQSYFTSNIGPEIQAAITEVHRQENAGRNQKVTWSAAQFDSGGFISGFGDMATGPYTGFIHATLGERVMKPGASAQHGPMLDAMNSGTYSRSPRLMAPAPPPAGSPVSLTVQALDAASVEKWGRNGGAQLIQSMLNQNNGRYSGVALG